MDASTLLLLMAAAAIAGYVDAIAGGGGLITLPALLLAGLSPVEAVATNKLQGTVGVASSSLTFWRRGEFDPREILVPVLAAGAGSGLGALTVGAVDQRLLMGLMPIALVGVAIYFAWPARAEAKGPSARLSRSGFALLVAFPIGFYDGLFGPGTGAFFMLCLVGLMALPALKATASTKALNLSSNVAALAVFSLAGHVDFRVGIPMAVAQLIGGYLGARTAIAHGARLIRPLLVVVTLAVAAKLLLDPSNPWHAALNLWSP